MTEPTKRPTGAAVAAALSPFLGLPLTFLFLLLSVGIAVPNEFEASPWARVVEVWYEGGWPMYAIVGVGGLLSIIAAVFMFFGVHRGSAVVLANAPLAAVLVAVGAFGYWQGMDGAVAAIAHAAAADRATILAGATGEALSTSLFSLCAMGGLLVALSAGAFFGVLAQQGPARRLLLAAIGVFLSLSLVAKVFASRIVEVSGSFRAVAHASPVDRLTILVGVSEELGRYRLFTLGAFALLAVVVVGAAVLLKATPRLAVMVPLMGFGGLFGFGAQEVARKAVDGMVEAMASTSSRIGLVELEGYPGLGPRWCVSGATIVDCEDGSLGRVADRETLEDEVGAAVRQLHELGALRGEGASLGLTPGAQASTMWQFMLTAQRAKAESVGLYGESEPQQGPPLISEFRAIGKALELRTRRVPVGLGTKAELCGENDCAFATATKEALSVKGETWKAGRLEGDPSELKADVLLEATPELAPKTLIALAMAAASHHHRLVLVLSEQEATDDDEEPSILGSSEADRAKVADLMKQMFGGELPKQALGDALEDDDPRAALAKVVRAHSREMKLCYEQGLKKNPKLAGRVVLSFVVKANGSVADVTVAEDSLKDRAVVECLRARPSTWKFEAGDEDLTVKFPFTFTAAE